MKKEKIDLSKITSGNIIDTDLWQISKTDFDTTYAKSLGKSPARLNAFKKRVISNFNKTGNMQLLLLNLRTIAIAQCKMSELAKRVKLERSSIYKILSKKANPSFCTIVSIAHNLGINFKLTAA